jgi:membrane-associated phospholipid phosphatase
VKPGRKSDVVGGILGLAVFAASALAASSGVVPGEAAVFRVVNGLPDSLYPGIWPFMQFGVFVTIPILIIVALVMRQTRLAAAMAIGGIGVYFLAKVAKVWVDRGRPAELLPDVTRGREAFASGSLGYPSGHAAVAGALTVILTPYLPARWRWLPLVLLAIVIVGRLYVSAHLPLDLIGGAALGVAAGCAANLIVGVPVPQASAPHPAAGAPT